MRLQEPLPKEYIDAPESELGERIAEHKRRFGKQLCILGHHYQRDEIIRHADIVGDSLKLSQQAGRTDARYIVFCGVHFMAESADILSKPQQVVCLPNLAAGCAMAEMADVEDVEACVEEMAELSGGAKVVPITYVNSTAAIKAVTARAGGACCTSSNALNVFAWGLRSADKGGAGADKLLCVPDQHLGRNTAFALGFTAAEDCSVYDPSRPYGGLDAEQARRAKFILWKGYCYVHQCFRKEHVEKVRREMPGVRVIVHPECPRELVALADASGSTEQIIQAVDAAPPGSKWAIGTESNLVERLARRHPEQTVRLLADTRALCRQMFRIDPAHLLWVLDNLAEGRVVNQVTVAPQIAADARGALQRMIDIQPVKTVTPTEY